MTRRIAMAAVEGFKNPFRLTKMIVMAVVSVVLAFVGYTPVSGSLGDGRVARHG